MLKRTQKTKKEENTKRQKNTLPVKAEAGSIAPVAKQSQKIHNRKYHPHNTPVAEVLVDICHKLIKKSIFLLIPWVILSSGILIAGSYIIFKEYFIGMAYPFWYLALVFILLFGIYGCAGLVYGLTMALLHTVLSVSSTLGEIIRKTVLRIKNSLESKVDKFADSLEQKNLLDIIKKTFEDISRNIRQYAAKTAVGVLVIAFLGGILFLIKNIVVRSFKKVQNKAEFFTKMSIRFTLLAAVLLNLRFFTKIALVLGYLVGILLILSQVLLWYIMQ